VFSEMQVHTKNQHEVIACRTKVRVFGAIKTAKLINTFNVVYSKNIQNLCRHRISAF